MEVKIADQALQDTVTTGLGGILLGALLWVGRFLVRLAGVPKRVANLEQTQAIMVGSQRAQTRAMLVLLDKAGSGDAVDEAKVELRKADEGLAVHMTALATGGGK